MRRFPTIVTTFVLALALLAGCKQATSSEGPRTAPPDREPLTARETPPPAEEPVPAAHSEAEALSELDRLYEKLTVTLVGRMLEERHLRQRRADDDVSRKAFEVFIDRLDPGKLFLLQEHVDRLSRFREQMDDQMESGGLELAHEAGALLSRRIGVVAEVVDGLLAKPLNLGDREEMETDEEKRGFARTEAELAERWRQVLELQALYRIERLKDLDGEPGEGEAPKADEPPRSPEEIEIEARNKLAETYRARFERLRQRDQLDRIERFLNAITAVYDPHTVYMPPRRKEDFDIRMSGTLEGIGAVLSEDDHLIKVVRIVPGSASWRQGQLKEGDFILAVAEDKGEPVDLVDMRLRDAVRLIRGPKGTTVRLTVKKPDGEVTVIPIVRDVVRIESAYAKGGVLTHPKAKRKVGYIDLSSFYGDTRFNKSSSRTASRDVRALLDAFKKKKVEAVILDLRGNGGGLLYEARAIAGLFIDQGPVVQTKDFDGRIGKLNDPIPGTEFDGPLVVLIDRFSASASEIVAGALQDYGRALVVGTDGTHGKGTVQSLISLDQIASDGDAPSGLPPLGAMKLTQQQYYRVNGKSVQQKGIKADVVLPDAAAHIESGERFHDYPVPWDEVPAAEYERLTPSWSVAELIKASAERIKDHPYFNKLQQRTALLKSRDEQTTMPLSLVGFEERRKREREELESLKLDDETRRFDVSVIEYAETRGPKEAAEESAKEWAEAIAADPWVEEALLLMPRR